MASWRLRKFSYPAGLILFTCTLVMGYYILQRPAPPPSVAAGTSASETAQWRARLEQGSAAERRQALSRLVDLRAEPVLTECLSSNQPALVQLAIAGLWECWLNDEGPAARQQLETGIEAMNAGNLDEASATFARLMRQYPHWAEAINKQATALYLQGKLTESIVLCREVVALKPDHFGAWNGMAICAVQTENWDLALQAIEESLRLQPHSQVNQQLRRLVQSRLPQV